MSAAGPAPSAQVITGIVDVHAQDGGYALSVFKQGGGVALIHKATEGGDFRDTGFVSALDGCKDVGLLQGAYHFANGKTPVGAQVRNFLDATAAYPNALKVLDWESNDRSTFGTMSLDQAVSFVSAVKEATGRWPVFYSFSSMLRAGLNGASAAQRETLANCPLWIAQYGEAPRAPAPWQTYDLWQYVSRQQVGPRNQVVYPRLTEGFREKRQDRNAWNGDLESLTLWWKTAGVPGFAMPSSRP